VKRAHIMGIAIAACTGAVVSPFAAARPAATPTISASAGAVNFGGNVTLKGTVPGAVAGEDVQIFSQACGFTEAVPVATVKTAAGGGYTFSIAPMLNSALSAEYAGARSNATRIAVSPAVQLRRVGGGVFAVDISAGNGAVFAKPVALQRLDPRTKRWVTIATSKLKPPTDPGALVAVSSGVFHATVRGGTTLRAYLSPAAAGSCYRPATSASLKA
jgi:hypothetical protein